MVNASRMLVEHLNGARAGDEALVTALLGEALTSLQFLGGFRIRGVVLPKLREEAIDELRAGLDALHRRPEPASEPPAKTEVSGAPAPATLEVAELERRVQSGELLRTCLEAAGPQMSVTLRTEPGAGGRQLRLSLSPALHAHWLEVEEEFHRIAGQHASFVAFMCFSLWATWAPFLEAWSDGWKRIYQRDLHRCTSPVCGRHDVTPHHLEFRAHGGGDEDENVTSLCAWCHLYGIHEGRLRAEPPASAIRWSIGRAPLLAVHGRERIQL